MIEIIFLAATVAATPVATARAHFAQLNLEANGALDVVGSDESAVINGILGRFHTGLTPEQSLDPKQATGAVAAFVRSNSRALGGDEDASDAPSITGSDLRVVDAYTHVIFMRQSIGGFDVLDGELTATFWPSGELRSVNGPLAFDSPNQRVNQTDTEAQTIADEWGELSISSEPMRLVALGYSVQTHGLAWLFETSQTTLWIDDATGAVFAASSKEDFGADSFFGNCNIRRRDLVRSDANATSFNEAATATRTELLQCGGDDWFGTYYWHLKRQNTLPSTSFKHEVGRVQDAVGGQLEIVTTDPNLVPQFTFAGVDSLHEQGAFYTQFEMRSFMHDNLWSNIIYQQEYNVHIKIDDVGVGTASFNDFTHEIRCNSTSGGCAGGDCCTQQALAHEFGHYVVDTYGDVSGNCTAGLDEGDNLDETLANVHAMIYFIDDAETLATYGAVSGAFNLGVALAPHTTAGTIVAVAPTCAASPTSADGVQFQQAVWELLWNFDCTVDTCTTGMTVDGNRIFVGDGPETVFNNVGTAGLDRSRAV